MNYFLFLDIPVIKSMFLRSIKLASTPLYLYANADILFDFGLIKTSLALLCALKKEADGNNFTIGMLSKGIFVLASRSSEGAN